MSMKKRLVHDCTHLSERCGPQDLTLPFLSLVLLDQHVSGAEAGGEQAG